MSNNQNDWTQSQQGTQRQAELDRLNGTTQNLQNVPDVVRQNYWAVNPPQK